MMLLDNFIFVFETGLLVFLARQFFTIHRQSRLRMGIYVLMLLVIHKVIAIAFAGSTGMVALLFGLTDYFMFGIIWPGQWLRRMFIIYFYYALMIAIDLLFILAVPAASVPLSTGQYQVTGMIVSRLLLALLIMFVTRPGRRNHTIENLFVFLAPLPVLIAVVLLISHYGYEVHEVAPNQNLSLLIIVIVLTVLILLYAYIRLARNEEVLQERLRMQEEMRSTQEEYCTAVIKSYGSIRSTRHDLHHYLDAVTAFIYTRQYQEALNICSHALQRTGKSLIFTGNETVDAIIYSKQTLYEQIGAVISVDGVLPATLNYDSADICIVLSNALQNAAEAVAVLPAEQRIVYVRFRFEKWLLITVENAIVTPPKFHHGRYISNKGSEHGIGMDNIAAACRRQNGYMETTIEDGVFILAATMQPE
ncbi:MAG: GHKL domain-containing protein [Lachnospiraceae bacterium]